MKKIGIVVKSFGMSQKAFACINMINEFLHSNQNIDVIGFYETYGKQPIRPEFAIMQLKNLWGFYGNVITTDCESTLTALASPTINDVYMYIWNLEWIFNPRDFEYYTNIYMNDRVHLIARSQEHSYIIEQCWKEPSAIIEDFNNEQFNRLLKTI